MYHVMNRGDQPERIFQDDEDRERFLATLGEACQKTGWQVHAWCLMSNHCLCLNSENRHRRDTGARRESEANGPTRAKTGQRKLRKPSWTEFARLADQAVVAIAGAGMTNRAEPRACGYSRGSRRLDTKWPDTDEPQIQRQTQPGRVSEARRMTRLAPSRTGKTRRAA
jgi:hypothetical protein